MSSSDNVVVENVHALVDPIDDQIDHSCKVNLFAPSVDTSTCNDRMSCDEESTKGDLFEKKDSILKIHSSYLPL